MRKNILIFMAAGGLSAHLASAEMSIRVDEATQRYTIEEDGRPVLTYNFGTNPVPPGVSGIYAVPRGNYVHPLYGPAGEVLSMDFSPDHPHHRGLYWAWPVVGYAGATADLHALQGVFARPVRILGQKADAQAAELSAENVWLWKDVEPIVKETATITAQRAEAGLRAIDFAFRFEALKPGVTLARRHGDAYGGFNLRFSARRDQRVDKAAADWAELRGVPPDGKETVGVLLLQAPSNPGFPGDWIDYPPINWLQPTFPAKGATYALLPGQPLELRYRLVVRSGAGLDAKPEALAEAYAATLPDPLADLARHSETNSRLALTAMEAQLKKATEAGRRSFEKRVLAVLAQAGTSGDFRRWACKQLVVAGSDAAVPAAAALLKDDAAWMQAADVLFSRPGDAGLAALREALPGVPAGRQPALINLLAMRRDERAVPLLKSMAAGADTNVAAAALTALGEIGTEEAARALLDPLPAPALAAIWGDAILGAADRAAAEGRKEAALNLYQRLANEALPPWVRGAGLRGWVALQPAANSLERVRTALAGDDEHLRHGAVAALRAMPDAALSGLRATWTGSTDAVRLALINAWGDRGLRAAEPELVEALASSNAAISLEAVRALRTAGSPQAVGPLLALAAQPGERGKEAQATLAQMKADGVADALRVGVRDTNTTVAVTALKSLGARRADGYRDDLLAALADGRRELARAAAGELRTDGTADLLPKLRALLISTSEEATQKDIAQALVATCKRQPDSERALASVLADPPLEGQARKALLAALPVIGGETALSFAARAPDEASARALLNWPDATALEPLLAIAAKASDDPALQRLAAAGYVQLVQRTLPAGRQIAPLARILPYITDDAEHRRLADLIEGSNLALRAPASGSRPNEAGHLPEHAVDGDRTRNSYWGCTPPPAALTVDLVETQRIDRINLCTYWDGVRYYQYLVEASADGSAWTSVADMRTNTAPATEDGVVHRFAATEARFVRATMTSNSVNPGLHIVELEVFAPVPKAGEGKP